MSDTLTIPIDKFIDALLQMADWHKVDGGHVDRVSSISAAIGRELGLTQAQLMTLGYGACLHDIGRVGVDDDVIKQTGILTSSQRAAMNNHVFIGYEIIRNILPVEISEVVLYHHENYDGTGYPKGLLGDKIPLFARIVAVADRWDALRSDRPYRKALNYENSLHIMNMSVSHFDPKIYAIFLKVIRSERDT